MPELEDFEIKPKPEHPETDQHWLMWLIVGMVRVLNAKTLEESKTIANDRLKEVTDPVRGTRSFSFETITHWRSYLRK